MNAKNWGLSIIEAVIWYFFAYYALFAVKTGFNIWIDALVLVVLAYLGVMTCPWFRNTEAWRKMSGE